MSNTKETKKTTINIEPIEFDGLLASKLTTTVELSRLINSMFRPIFRDYEGCVIQLDPQGIFQLMLYFSVPTPGAAIADSGRIANVEPIVKPVTDANDAMARIRNINNINSARKNELTQDTKDALSEFMYGYSEANPKINWNQLVTEITDRATFNGYTIHVAVKGLDLLRVIRKIYGNKKDGNYVEYRVTCNRPLNNTNYLIFIEQVDTKMVEKMCHEAGMIPTTGSLQMVRD